MRALLGGAGRIPNLRGRLRGNDGLFFIRVHPVSFDKQAFFKQQIEECRELARHAINADDQAFWKLSAIRDEQGTSG
jgi:hypothetical protein